MSHFNTLRSKLSDAEILKASLRDPGFTVRTDSVIRGFGCQQAKAEIVAQLDDSYDIGWSRNADGSFDLIADLWVVSRKHNLTGLMNSINQKYAVNKSLTAVKRPGLQNATVQVVVPL